MGGTCFYQDTGVIIMPHLAVLGPVIGVILRLVLDKPEQKSRQEDHRKVHVPNRRLERVKNRQDLRG